jgi:phosphoribosylformylglycinamidine synthase
VRLYSESPTRFVVEIAPAHESAFSAALAGIPHARIGTVSAGPSVTFMSHQQVIASLSVDAIVDAFHTDIL